MFKVLIVEDDPMVARINEQYVNRNRNFSVVGKCRDGKSALNFLAQQEVDLVFLDVVMPQMDGFETLQQIRKRNYSLEVIMVTAANDKKSLTAAMHLGVMDYLIKPFEFERFQAALEKYLAQVEALKDLELLNQKKIDYILDGARKRSGQPHPKGIQEKTLELIMEQMKRHETEWLTGDAIAESTGLTGVTVRRYMNYLTEKGMVLGEMNYETGGRPCMLYHVWET